MMASRSAIAEGFSILAMHRRAAVDDACAPSSRPRRRCTNDRATQSTPRRSAQSRSFRSFSVSGPIGSTVSGRLMPLRLASVPPTSTLAAIAVFLVSTTRMRILPSSSSSVWPGSTASKICGCGRNTRSALPGALGRVEAEDRAVVDEHAAAAELAEAELRPLQVGSMPIGWRCLLADRAHGVACSFSRQVVRRMAHVDAEDVDARHEQALDHLGGDDAGPKVATILTRRLRLISPYAPFARIGQADGPVIGLSGVDLEKSRALIAAFRAFLHPPDCERLVCRAHEVLAGPFAAAVVVDGVDVQISGSGRPLSKRFAGLRRDVPPAFGRPAVVVAGSRWRRRCGSWSCCTA